MPTLRAGARSERGFTLIELTMVILVIGIVGALVLPRFGGLLDRQQMRRTVNVVRGMVRQLHAKAALTKRVYRLTFDLDEQQLSVCFLESLPASGPEDVTPAWPNPPAKCAATPCRRRCNFSTSSHPRARR